MTSTPDATAPPRLLGAADRAHDDSPGVVHRLDIAAGIPQHKRDDPQAGLEGLVNATVMVFGDTRLPPNGLRGECRRLTNDGSDVV